MFLNSQPAPWSRRSRRPVGAAIVVVVALTLSGCGNRLSDERLAAGAGATAVVAASDTGAVAPGDAGVAVGAVDTGALAPGVGGQVPVVGAPSPPGTVPAAVTGGTAAQPGKGTGAAAAVPGKSAAGASAPKACTGNEAPLILGQTGSFSGLIGASIGAHRLGVAMWVKAVNAAGGIQCHPVKVYQADDGSSPAQAASNVNDFVKNKGAVALLDICDPIVLSAVRAEIAKLKVPIVGGDLSDPGWTQDPLVFAQGVSPIQGFAGGIATAAKVAKVTKISVLYCVEAAICELINKSKDEMAASSGTTLVHSQSISLTQSSYTAECQNAKNAGAQMIFGGVDGSALTRMGTSCASLGYFPAFGGPGIAFSETLSKNQALRKAGVYLGTVSAPFMTTDQPGTKAFHEAAEKYAPGQAIDQSASDGWTSGKLMEAALNALGAELRDRPITTADIFSGLYLLKGETLGGLASPLTYKKGQPSPINGCYFSMVLGPDGFFPPFGSKRQGKC